MLAGFAITRRFALGDSGLPLFFLTVFSPIAEEIEYRGFVVRQFQRDTSCLSGWWSGHRRSFLRGGTWSKVLVGRRKPASSQSLYPEPSSFHGCCNGGRTSGFQKQSRSVHFV